MRDIVVTGADGFIGSLLVKKLHRMGHRVYSIVKPSSIDNVFMIKDFSHRVIVSDINNESIFKKLPSKIDTLIHLAWAGVNGPSKGDEMVQNKNIELALCAANISKRLLSSTFIGVGTITELAYLSSAHDYHALAPSLVYGKFKNKCREALKKEFINSDVAFIWLRLSNLYGATNKTGNILSYTISELSNNRKPILGPCDQYYDFLLVDDAVDAIARFAELDKTTEDIYFIGSSSPRILKKYIIEVARQMGKKNDVLIGKRDGDGMIFKKHFFDNSPSVKTIGIYESLSFEKNIQRLIADIMKEPLNE